MATFSPPRTAAWVTRRRRPGREVTLLVVAGVIALALLSPLVLVALDAHSAGWGEIHRTLFRARSVMLLRHTVVLAAIVAVAAAVLGTGTAWLTERTALPARRPGPLRLVYLPVAAALRRTDPSMEEAAQSLGVGPISTFRRVTLPLVRTAILGGGVLVGLTVISEFGAFEILGYQTFTTEIFTEF